MKNFFILLLFPGFLWAQSPVPLRSTVSATGASKAITFQGSTYLIQSSIAQRSTVGTQKQGSLTLRQGFIQPYALTYWAVLDAKDDLGISLYPNPTRGLLYFTSEKQIEGNIHLQVTDSRGKVINTVRYQQAPNTISLSHLAGGLYYLQFRLGQKQQTIPVTKL